MQPDMPFGRHLTGFGFACIDHPAFFARAFGCMAFAVVTIAEIIASLLNAAKTGLQQRSELRKAADERKMGVRGRHDAVFRAGLKLFYVLIITIQELASYLAFTPTLMVNSGHGLPTLELRQVYISLFRTSSPLCAEYRPLTLIIKLLPFRAFFASFRGLSCARSSTG